MLISCRYEFLGAGIKLPGPLLAAGIMASGTSSSQTQTLCFTSRLYYSALNLCHTVPVKVSLLSFSTSSKEVLGYLALRYLNVSKEIALSCGYYNILNKNQWLVWSEQALKGRVNNIQA